MKVKIYMDSVMWFFGLNRTQAAKFIREATDERLEGIKKAFEENAKISFYYD